MYTTTATWYVGADRAAALEALTKLAADVERAEPGTVAYLIHTPGPASLPPPPESAIVFVEMYADDAAFQRHLSGPVLASFMKQSGHLFQQDPSTKQAFIQYEQLHHHAGFIRAAAASDLRNL